MGARLDVVKPCPGVGGGSGRAGASCGPYARGAGRRGGRDCEAQAGVVVGPVGRREPLVDLLSRSCGWYSGRMTGVPCRRCRRPGGEADAGGPGRGPVVAAGGNRGPALQPNNWSPLVEGVCQETTVMPLRACGAKRSRPQGHVVAVRRPGEGCRLAGENCVVSHGWP